MKIKKILPLIYHGLETCDMVILFQSAAFYRHPTKHNDDKKK